MNEHLQRYRAAVQHPTVSGFELLDVLMLRDKLATQSTLLSSEEQDQLEVADQILITHAREIVAELARITSLDHEREQRNATQERWWWYLDVLAAAPIGRQSTMQAATVAA